MKRTAAFASAAAAVVVLPLGGPARAPAPRPAAARTVATGQTWVVEQTTRLSGLTLQPGGAITAPAGKDVVLVVNGVETGGAIESTGGTRTVIQPGTWRGSVVLDVVDENAVSWQGLTFPLRQALYVGPSGVVDAKSVAPAYSGRVTDTSADGLAIRSTGENFGGVYVAGGSYALTRPRILLTGNGRSDFIGDGAALVGTGGAQVVVDGARIDNTGVVRTGVLADGGSNVVVKNSTIATHDGTLPDDYRSTVDVAYMQQAPWMLGIVGNVRATNLMGTNTRATYLNSRISSTGWGLLSTDTGQNVALTAINSTLRLTGDDGYGSYAIGGATEEFLGDTFDVADYLTIIRGGTVHYGDSDRSDVAALNTSLGLGLTRSELRSLAPRSTTVTSDRFGVMWHGGGSVTVDGATTLRTGETTFLDKGQKVDVTVDGSRGARISSGTRTIFQLMEDDDPGPVMVDGKLLNAGTYTEPTDDATRIASFDTAAVHPDDAIATFRSIELVGDFWNAFRGGAVPGTAGTGANGKNLALTFDDSHVTGVISSSASHHSRSTLTAADYTLMGEVTNTAQPSVNNGVIVTLGGRSTWTVTGTSYLTSLTVGSHAWVVGPSGSRVTMTVDGVPTPIVPGTTYTGAIVLTRG